VTRQEQSKRLDELAREYHDTHDAEIPEEIFELARQLGEMDHDVMIAKSGFHRCSLWRRIQ
jgi:hypothetical protein